MEKERSDSKRNGSRRRSSFEIWSELLEVCARTPRTQSWLRRNLRLKTSGFKEAIEFLMVRGLIKEVNNFGSFEYLTTKKGEEALLHYYKLINRFFVLDF
ncbi:MAG: winged helix-turn-helix domain-containing protein [Candidatus Heimdallarchaeota archaeon]